VGRDLDLEALVVVLPGVRVDAHVLMRPKVADAGRAGRQADLGPTDVLAELLIGVVDEGHGLGAVGQGLHPDLTAVAALDDDVALDAERVLVDLDDLLVEEDRPRLLGHGPEVVAGHERRGHDRPQREMGLVLVEGHAAVADLEHVGIVPAAGPGRRGVPGVGPDDPDDALPVVADVGRRPPELADAPGPLPGVIAAPLADAQDDRPAGPAQGVAEAGVFGGGVEVIAVAPVDLDVIDPPLGVGHGVDVEEALGGRAAGAGLRPDIGIEAEQQAPGVDVVGQGLHAAGELDRVGDDPSVGAPVDLPAVVDDQVLVSGVAHAGLDHGVGRLADQGLVDVATELVPGVETHGRHGRQELRRGGCGLLRRAAVAGGEQGHGQNGRQRPSRDGRCSHRTLLGWTHADYKAAPDGVSIGGRQGQTYFFRKKVGLTLSSLHLSCKAPGGPL